MAALAALTALAWAWMTHEARGMTSGACCCMVVPDTNPWNAKTLAPLFFMWVEMMVAMMIPSAAPIILTFAMVQRKRREQERPFVPTGILLAGYLYVWAIFSAFAAVMQWFLHAKALLTPMMVSNNSIFGGTILAAAGIFQFTPLKNVCLTHCRSPLSFLMANWREEKLGAFVMGLKHGAYCAGCCWILMLLLFLGGVMNLFWIAAISIFVLLERILPKRFLFEKFAGVILIAWAVLVFI